MAFGGCDFCGRFLQLHSVGGNKIMHMIFNLAVAGCLSLIVALLYQAGYEQALNDADVRAVVSNEKNKYLTECVQINDTLKSFINSSEYKSELK